MRKVWLALAIIVLSPFSWADEPKVRGPIEATEDAIQEKKSEEQLRIEENKRKIEAERSQRSARVVVLEWENSNANYKNETLKRNIRVRLDRNEAQFFPAIDLYQQGRAENRSDRKRSIRPEDQRAVVPNASIDRVLMAAEETAQIPWDALSPELWGLEADKLRTLLEDEMWFIDRVELREPLFLMYAQIGRAAESSNNPAPPYYAQVGSSPVNYYYYLAGVLAHEDPALLSKLTDRELNASINNYKTQLDRGVFDPVTLSFDLDNSWDADAYGSGPFPLGLHEAMTWTFSCWQGSFTSPAAPSSTQASTPVSAQHRKTNPSECGTASTPSPEKCTRLESKSIAFISAIGTKRLRRCSQSRPG